MFSTNLGKKDVHLALNIRSDFQSLVNVANTCIKEVVRVRQFLGNNNIEHVIHHDKRSSSFCHIATCTYLRAFKVDEQLIT